MKAVKQGLLISVTIAVLACGYVLVADPDAKERVRELEQQIEALRAQPQGGQSDRAAAITAPVAQRPVVERMNHPSASAEELAAQVAQLAHVVDRLEQTARGLDSRIMRSRLAVPTREEQAVQIERGKARLLELRNSAGKTRTAARQIVESMHVPYDEEKLLERGTSAALEANSAFVAARDAASLDEAIVKLFEKRLADLQFARSVESLPRNDSP